MYVCIRRLTDSLTAHPTPTGACVCCLPASVRARAGDTLLHRVAGATAAALTASAAGHLDEAGAIPAWLEMLALLLTKMPAPTVDFGVNHAGRTALWTLLGEVADVEQERPLVIFSPALQQRVVRIWLKPELTHAIAAGRYCLCRWRRQLRRGKAWWATNVGTQHGPRCHDLKIFANTKQSK